MGTLINLFVRLSGLGWVWGKVDGYKTYGTAVVSILTGVLGLAVELSAPLSSHNAAGVWAIVQNLPHDQSWAAIVFGLGLLGVGHKLNKASDSNGVPLPNQPATPQV